MKEDDRPILYEILKYLLQMSDLGTRGLGDKENLRFFRHIVTPSPRHPVTLFVSLFFVIHITQGVLRGLV